MALRGLTKKHIGRAAVVGAIDGAIAGGSTYGVEKIKEIAGKEIGEEYDVNMVNVGAAAVLGGYSNQAQRLSLVRSSKIKQPKV